MKIKNFHKNDMRQNVYLYYDENTNKGYIIDAGCGESDLNAIGSYLSEKNINIEAILITHGHFDHIVGAEGLKKLTGVKIYCHKLEKEMLEIPEINLGTLRDLNISVSPDELLGDKFDIFEVLHVPGHTPGSVCFYDAENGVLFSGDVLFRESIGRTDLPGSNHANLVNGIKEKLFTLPDGTKVYPGHGFNTTIGHEKNNNPFIR